jgi:hypothetical protein
MMLFVCFCIVCGVYGILCLLLLSRLREAAKQRDRAYSRQIHLERELREVIILARERADRIVVLTSAQDALLVDTKILHRENSKLRAIGFAATTYHNGLLAAIDLLRFFSAENKRLAQELERQQ